MQTIRKKNNNNNNSNENNSIRSNSINQKFKQKKQKYKKIRQLNSIFILSFLLPQSSSIIIFDCVNNKSFKI